MSGILLKSKGKYKKEGVMPQSLKAICIVFTAAIFLTGCQTLGSVIVKSPGHHQPPPPSKYKKHGPPPHAPAHGYRHKHHDGHELEYDSKIGAYIVINIPDTYFGNDLYLRMSTDGTWMVSATLESGWRVALTSEVPPKMRYHKHKDKNKHHKHKKHKKYYDD